MIFIAIYRQEWCVQISDLSNLSYRCHSVSLLLLTHPSIPGSNLCPPPPPPSVSHCLSVELMNLSWGVLFLPACRCRRQSALQADSRAARQAQVRGAPPPPPPSVHHWQPRRACERLDCCTVAIRHSGSSQENTSCAVSSLALTRLFIPPLPQTQSQ